MTKGEGDLFGLVGPPVICQIPGICVRASVIVPFLPIGGACEPVDGLSGPSRYRLSDLSATAVCTGEKTITVSKRCFWVLPSL